MQRKLHFKRLNACIPHNEIGIFLKFLTFYLKWSVCMEMLEKIKHFRQCQNLTQEQMAEKLEIAPNTYGSIERGETELTVNRLIKIANIFQIPPNFLLDSLTDNFIFNSIGDNSNKNSQNLYTNTSIEQLKLKYELEKSQLIIEQQEKEIEHLNKIIKLMEKESST